MSKKPKVIVIVGPTGVGKTALSIQAAQTLNGEVISGDSMQVYKGLSIGTAKVTEEEKQGIQHYLLDVKNPNESFTASDFKQVGRAAIEAILAKGKVPIIAGGTGLYIEALLYDLPLGSVSSTDEKVRKKLEEEAKRSGTQEMWDRLKNIDPLSAEAIHPNNVRRVIRALEVFETTGELFSSQKKEKKESLYTFLLIGLTSERQTLYDRINHRVERMMSEGLEQEARTLWTSVSSDSQASKGIGYKEFIPYFEGTQSLEDVVSKIQQHSRNYAKRQLTWFRNRLPEVTWYDFIQSPKKQTEALAQMKDFVGTP